MTTAGHSEPGSYELWSLGQDQFVELAKAVAHLPTLKIDRGLALLHVDARHDAEIAVVDLLVVIVLDLHGLIARVERPADRCSRQTEGADANDSFLGQSGLPEAVSKNGPDLEGLVGRRFAHVPGNR